MTATQVHELDNYTIAHQRISSIDLMERASTQFFKWLIHAVENDKRVIVFCGKGNNGGDGLAVARMLLEAKYDVQIFVIEHSSKASKNYALNLKRLDKSKTVFIKTAKQIPVIKKSDVIIDAIFGTGLSKAADGISASVINAINKSKAVVYSIDVPSGLFADKLNSAKDAVVQSTCTFTFHAPKLSFLFSANGKYVPDFEVLEIGLDKYCAEKFLSDNFYVNKNFIQSLFKKREKFSHKGDYGHAFIAAGSFGKIGAAVLATKAALRSGAGLVTTLVPACGYDILQTSAPEAMCMVDGDSHLFKVPDLSSFNSIAVGCGIGTNSSSINFVYELLKFNKPLVLDADALNVISDNKNYLNLIPKDSVLTPHPGEFKRLVGEWKDDVEKLEKQKQFSKTYEVVVVLKGAHTSVSSADGKIYFNSTGNPGMAKGGSGDVLTGIIAALIAQNYSPLHAAIIAVYLHGLAGDYAKHELGETAMKASDIIYYLPKVFRSLE
ncbi:MAG: NAD(P)H-hydrate dehydratase [Bacteroidetes bacterium]|nr:NAD(P)H-hydrate dehydratase [Bacteroidota bacterium]